MTDVESVDDVISMNVISEKHKQASGTVFKHNAEVNNKNNLQSSCRLSSVYKVTKQFSFTTGGLSPRE